MEITKDLNLAFPIRWSEKVDKDGNPVPSVWAFHTPISRAVFEANYRVIANTQIALAGKGRIGFRIATLALKDAARADAREFGIDSDAGAAALLAEIKRLTTVMAPSESGYRAVDIDRAIANDVIDEEDWEEAQSTLVFFTCAYAICPRAARESVAAALALVMRGSITSSSPSAFAASLAPSTTGETSSAVVEPDSAGRSPVPQ